MKQEAVTQSLGSKAKRRKVPGKSPDDSVKITALVGSSSLETKPKSPEHDSNMRNPKIIDKVPVSPDKIVQSPSIEVLQTNFKKIELTKSDASDNGTGSDISVDKEKVLCSSLSNPETPIKNLTQGDDHTNASQVETAAYVGFPELSLNFEENDEQLEAPEFVEDRMLKTPEISENQNGNFKLSGPNEIEDSVPDEESGMHNYLTREEWETEYLNQGNTLQCSEDLADEEAVKGDYEEPISGYAQEEYESNREDYGEHISQYEKQSEDGIAQYEGDYELEYENEDIHEYETTREEYEEEYQEGEEPLPQYEGDYHEGEELAQYEGGDNLGYAGNNNFDQYESTREDYDEPISQNEDEVDDQKSEQCEERDKLENEDNDNDSSRDDSEEATSQSENEVEEEESAQSDDGEANENDEDSEVATSQSEEEVEKEESSNEETESEQESETDSKSEEETEDNESENDESTSESDEEENELTMLDDENIDNNDQLKIETSEEVDEAKLEYKDGDKQEFLKDLKTDENYILENEKENVMKESTTAHSEDKGIETMTTSMEALNVTLCCKEPQKKSPEALDTQTLNQLGESNKESCDKIISKLHTAFSGEFEAPEGVKLVDNLQSRVSDKLLVSVEYKRETKGSSLAKSIDKSPGSKRGLNSDHESDSFSSMSFGHSEDNMSTHSPIMKVESKRSKPFTINITILFN